MVDLDDNRLELSKKLCATHIVNSKNQEAAIATIIQIADGIGVDVVIEEVGFTITFEMCQKLVSPGGRITNVGVHGKSVELHLEDLWIKNINISTGLVSTYTTPMLLKTVESGEIKPEELVTHHFTFDEILEAYKTFENLAKSQVLKVIIDF